MLQSHTHTGLINICLFYFYGLTTTTGDEKQKVSTLIKRYNPRVIYVTLSKNISVCSFNTLCMKLFSHFLSVLQEVHLPSSTSSRLSTFPSEHSIAHVFTSYNVIQKKSDLDSMEKKLLSLCVSPTRSAFHDLLHSARIALSIQSSIRIQLKRKWFDCRVAISNLIWLNHHKCGKKNFSLWIYK